MRRRPREPIPPRTATATRAGEPGRPTSPTNRSRTEAHGEILSGQPAYRGCAGVHRSSILGSAGVVFRHPHRPAVRRPVLHSRGVLVHVAVHSFTRVPCCSRFTRTGRPMVAAGMSNRLRRLWCDAGGWLFPSLPGSIRGVALDWGNGCAFTKNARWSSGGGAVDIRSAQKRVWDNKTAKGFNTTDVATEFCLLRARTGR